MLESTAPRVEWSGLTTIRQFGGNVRARRVQSVPRDGTLKASLFRRFRDKPPHLAVGSPNRVSADLRRAKTASRLDQGDEESAANWRMLKFVIINIASDYRLDLQATKRDPFRPQRRESIPQGSALHDDLDDCRLVGLPVRHHLHNLVHHLQQRRRHRRHRRDSWRGAATARVLSKCRST